MFLTAQQNSSPWHSRVLLTLLVSMTLLWTAVPDLAVATPRPDTNAIRMDSAPAEDRHTGANLESSMATTPRPAAPAPLTVTYQSATTNYRLYDDNPPGDWRAANERVGEIGGWRTYAKEAYEASERKSQEDASSGVTQ